MTTSVQVIGYSEYKEFGNKLCDNVSELQDCEINKISTQIDQVISGNEFSIYLTNDNDQNIWTAGKNTHGQCATNNFSCIKDTGFHKLQFFQNNNIKIRKICTNPHSNSIFWITEANQVYANGANDKYQLGVSPNTDIDNKCKPVLITRLKNVIDIQPAATYSIALCSNASPKTLLITQFWCRTLSVNVPDDIIKLILKFRVINKVYSVGSDAWVKGARGHGHTDRIIVTTWKEIAALRKKHIQMIRVGGYHSFFLDSNGNVWCCGDNKHGQLGLGHITNIDKISRIDFFKKQEIRISHIECGSNFSVMMDCDGKVWIFGDNRYGQIGDGLKENVNTPKELIMFRDKSVEWIRCGLTHCCVKCDNDEFYLWGENDYNQCLVFDDELDQIYEPKLAQLNGKRIKDIFVGYDNTLVIAWNA